MTKIKQKAFTLIEILIAIAIIGIIASIVVIQLNSSREKSRQARLLKYADSVRAQLSSNEVAWWKLDESSASCSPSANCVKDAWNGNNGTPYNIAAAQFGQSGVGKGTALSFNGSYISVPAPSGSGFDIKAVGGAFTLEAWINPNSLTDMQEIINRQSPGGYGINLRSNGSTLVLNIGLHGGGNKSGTIPISTGQWYHVVGVINKSGDYARTYVNGVLDVNVTADPITGGVAIVDSVSNMAIGGNPGAGGRYFSGLIDEVRIWNSALTAMEIQQRYAESAPRHGIALK